MNSTKELLYTFGEAAEDLGTTRPVISELVRRLAIVPKPIRSNRRAKGLTGDDLRRIGSCLGPNHAGREELETP